MVLFNRLLNDQCFTNEPAYKLFKDVIEKILDEYFSVFKKNKILPIECLFHIEGLSLIIQKIKLLQIIISIIMEI